MRQPSYGARATPRQPHHHRQSPRALARHPALDAAKTNLPVTVQINILNGSTVVRTLTSTLSANGSGVTSASDFTAYYAEADQVIDFGSKQASVSVMAYALNALVGRGYGGAETI